MNRRTRSNHAALTAVSLSLTAFAAAPACRSNPTPEESEARNVPRGVVLFLADDVGVEAFGCYGGESYRTPRIDALAAEGMRFTRFHAQPLCTPSRVKILTGRSNLRNYRRFSTLDPDETTIADVMGGAGYTTAAVGKWQLFGAEHYDEWAGVGARPEEAGFERWCLWQVERLGSRYWQPLLEVDGEIVEGARDDYGPREFLSYALQFLDEHRDQPFFLFYPLALVHDPFVPTPDSASTEQSSAANFADMVAELDRTVGAVVDRLDALGLSEDTLVLFTSDNGTSRRITSRRDGQDVEGGKRLTVDRGTNVPLIARWSGTVAPRSTCTDLMDLSDVFPTLMELCNTQYPAGVELDGWSFAPRLLGKPHQAREWISVYSNPRPGNAAFAAALFVRDKRFKLYEDGRYFDLHEDPEELIPLDPDTLTADAAAGLAELRAALASLPPPNDDMGGAALRARRRAQQASEDTRR